jgi:hypothetical protein
MSGLPERIQEAGLPALGRDAWVEVRLDAIATNVRALKGKLPAGGHLDVVLKADAYGLGAVPVARAAFDAGVGRSEPSGALPLPTCVTPPQQE